MSVSHAEMTLGLKNQSYCLTGSFLCELEFMNIRGQPDALQNTLTPWSCGNCESLDKENVKLRQQYVALKSEVARLQEIVNSSLDKTLGACIKGMHRTDFRTTFLLWGNVSAMCDTETDGGGWIVIQRRTKGDVDFYRTWNDYKKGFGTPDTDFWIGNDVIHNLTSQGYIELRIDMEQGTTRFYAHYSHFSVADETSHYRLSVSGYKGGVGDYLSYHSGNDFTTRDRDYDRFMNGNCATLYRGAWWYHTSYHSNLNGIYGAQDNTAVAWGTLAGGKSVISEMKLRRV